MNHTNESTSYILHPIIFGLGLQHDANKYKYVNNTTATFAIAKFHQERANTFFSRIICFIKLGNRHTTRHKNNQVMTYGGVFQGKRIVILYYNVKI